MKAVVSTTYDDKYLFFLPIITWCWNKLGVDVICFFPTLSVPHVNKMFLLSATLSETNASLQSAYFFCPEHKEATYAQCSRLFASALDFPEDAVLITSDVDMAVLPAFPLPPDNTLGHLLGIIGADLVPQNQYPMCYAAATVKTWRKFMHTGGATYQQRLDDLLGHIECDDFKPNYWAKDQETLFNYSSSTGKLLMERAKPGTQFASRRYDRDDAYILDRLSPDTIDFHMNRPGYEENNFNIIMTILQYHYPNENLDWLRTYREQYIKLL